MAGNGPAPKDRRSRDRDTKLLNDLVYNGQVFGDPLPDDVLYDKDGNPQKWHPMTVEWWESIRRWPLMEKEPEASWRFMIDTALMHHQMWRNGRWEFAAEIRLREAKYGIMPDDRKRLGLKYKPKADAEEPGESGLAAVPDNVTSIEERKKRLTAQKSPPAKKTTARKAPAKKKSAPKKRPGTSKS